jgi:hypothetical protein
VGDDLAEGLHLRVAGGAEHPHEALGGFAEGGAELNKPDGSIHIRTEHGFSGVRISCNYGLDNFTEERTTECGVILQVSFDGFAVFSGGYHRYAFRFDCL